MTRNEAKQSIHVHCYAESDTVIGISYYMNGQPKELIVDKEDDTDLMEFYSGQICQLDAIEMVIAHELELNTRGFLDITKPEGLLETINQFNRVNNKIYNVKA